MTSYWKDVLRQIRSTMGRFLSILVISALGVGSFAGLRSVSPDMRLTADRYYDDTMLMDIRVLSTLGFADADMSALRETGYAVTGGHMLDAMITLPQGGTEYTAKFYAYDAPREINLPTLLEGRLPQSADECALSQSLMNDLSLSIGDRIRVASGKEDPITDDILIGDSLTVTGVVLSSMYVSSREYGGSSIGDGTLSGYGILPMEAFSLDVYTAAFLRLPGADAHMAGEEEYKAAVEEAVDALEAVAAVREPARYDEIVAEAEEKLQDAEKELRDGELEREEKLLDARNTIDDAKQKLADAEAELQDGSETLEREIAKGRAELRDAEEELAAGNAEIIENQIKLDDAQKEIDEGYKELEEGRVELAGALNSLTDGLTQLDDGRRQLEKGQEELDIAKADLDGLAQTIAGMNPGDHALAGAQAQYAAGQAQYEAGVAQLSNGWSQYYDGQRAATEGAEQYESGRLKLVKAQQDLEKAQREVDEGRLEIRDAIAEIEQARIDIQKGYQELEKAEREGLEEIESARVKIEDAKIELADGEREYTEQEAESAAKIADAWAEIDDARKELDELEVPAWYIFTREDNPSYAEYFSDTERIHAIAAVFPAVFFGVAILISLTTMNRMVDEQRGLIGSFKLMGYSRAAIAGKYLLYAFLPCGGGSAIGIFLLGQYFFPLVVANAYGIQYDMPPLSTPLQVFPSMLAVAIIMGCVLLSALISVWAELRETPAQLLRPKAPRPGKRILLETIPMLWNRMNFSWKVTSRNIFRYKQRFLMTVVGIASCTALIVTGFGLRDSLNAVPGRQFDDIWLYDLVVAFDDAKLEEGKDGLAALLVEGGAKEMCLWRQDAVTTAGERRLDAHLTIIEDVETFQSMIVLRTYPDGAPLTLDGEGVVITYKIGKLLRLSVGDNITLTDTDNRSYTLPITGITENYIDHYIYITAPHYQRLTGITPEYNILVANLSDDSPEARIELGTALMATEGVLTRVFSADTRDSVGDMFGQLDIVVIVLIVFAAALALVVLYNLNNINIEERVRELATIKVLGFTAREVAAYVLRESVCLTLIGIAVGFLFGKALHGFVMGTAEVDMVMFTREIALVSYGYAGLLTVAFAALVSISMLPKLHKIDMVESLKSVD